VEPQSLDSLALAGFAQMGDKPSYGSTFSVTLQADGKILATESPPFNTKRQHRIGALLETMVALAKIISAQPTK
jgi:hypothetical protein